MLSKTSKHKPLPRFKLRAEYNVCKGDYKLRVVIVASNTNEVGLSECAILSLKIDLHRFGIDPNAVSIDLWDAQYFAEKRPLTGNWVPAVRTGIAEKKAKAIRQKAYLPEDFREAMALYGDEAGK